MTATRSRAPALGAAILLCLVPALAAAQPLLAAVLPSSRSVVVPAVATAFATIIDPGLLRATACQVGAPSTVPARFAYQTTNPSTNALVGTPNMPVDIPPGASQSFVIVFEPRFQPPRRCS